MDLIYHTQLVENTLRDRFGRDALQEVIAADLSQDDLPGLLLHPARHFDNDLIAEGLAYIDQEHQKIAEAATRADGGPIMRGAFGLLLHTAQDFYAHSNYVDLWMARTGLDLADLAHTPTDAIDGVIPDLLTSPDLRTWHFYLWRDLIYYVPGLKHIARRIYISPNSHEARHLDDPSRGPKFALAMQAAQDRTRWEYERALTAIHAAGGQAAVDRFHMTSRYLLNSGG